MERTVRRAHRLFLPDPEVLLKPSIDQFARTTNIIAFAIAAAVPIYIVVAWLVAPTVATAPGYEELVPLLAGIFAVLSAGHLVLAQVLFASRVRAAEKLPTPEERLASYRVTVIIAFALREAVAIYGLVLSLLGGDPRWCLGFGAVALVSMALGWPRRSVMERLASDVPPIAV
jgi:F0F1-type ATP synthase membrane subunit c/vacuolar-type H+-ATPase subunit K